jgi:hypothetical protein
MPTLEKRSMGIGIPIPMLRFLHFFHKSKKNMYRFMPTLEKRSKDA